MDTDPGRDLSSPPIGGPPTQADDLARGSFERWLADPAVIFAGFVVVAFVVGTLMPGLTARSDLAGLLVAVGTGLAVSVVLRVIAWALRERRIRRAADAALRERAVGTGSAGTGGPTATPYQVGGAQVAGWMGIVGGLVALAGAVVMTIDEGWRSSWFQYCISVGVLALGVYNNRRYARLRRRGRGGEGA